MHQKSNGISFNAQYIARLCGGKDTPANLLPLRGGAHEEARNLTRRPAEAALIASRASAERAGERDVSDAQALVPVDFAGRPPREVERCRPGSTTPA